jgi:hypothetical protein
MSNTENSSTDVDFRDSRVSTKAHASNVSYITGFNSRLFEAPPVSTEFEQMVESLRLEPHEYLHSRSLREWARRKRHDRYVPSDLLRQWGFD